MFLFCFIHKNEKLIQMVGREAIRSCVDKRKVSVAKTESEKLHQSLSVFILISVINVFANMVIIILAFL